MQVIPEVPRCSPSADFPVCVQKGLISPESCKEIIARAEERDRYDYGHDSIDGKPAMQVDILGAFFSQLV